MVDPGEDPAAAIAREIEEETGDRPAAVRPMTTYNALSGISDMRFTAFLASGAERTGPPADPASLRGSSGYRLPRYPSRC